MANIIAVIWDFDKTLLNGYMQDPIFAHYGVDGAAFWKEVAALPEKYLREQNVKVNPDTIYLNHFIRCAKNGTFPGLNNAMLREFGKELRFYPGIPEIFDKTRDMIASDPSFQEFDIRVEHYIVSTGMTAIIEGTEIRDHVDGVWGCEFIEEETGSGRVISEVGYTIDNTGAVRLPVLGLVQVGGMTCDQAAKAIEQTITQKNIIKNPDVTVRLLNARVAVLGAVKSPHVVSLTSERNTILDVLSQCGDLSDQGLREKVSLYREDNGIRQKYDLDLTQANIFESPAFYVQQNDLIYVQPNKSQNVRSSAFSTFLGVGGSVISALASVTALVISIVNLTK